MTESRPGDDRSRAQGPPGGAGSDRASGRAYDPLTDPLPGEHGAPWFPVENVQDTRLEHPAVQDPPQDWYGREAVYEQRPGPVGQPAPEPVARPRIPQPGAEPTTQVMPGLIPDPVPAPVSAPAHDAVHEPVFVPLKDDETVALRVPESTPETPVLAGGRAERRRAAKGRGRRGGAAVPAESVITAIPRTRVEARRAARALKDSPAVIASRAIGEIFISLGVLMLLFVTYQLWWTNVRAHQEANGTAHSLQEDWAKGGSKSNQPGAFQPGQGFAIIHIPKLDVVVPIAEGTSKHKVLDRGMVGHYSEGKLKTAMPSAKTGNFALAGHRNTHGEPFRYINKLENGDKVVVETRDDYYTYEVTSHLAQTSPSNVSVITPVPPGSGFTGPGRYITLTTCTPEFTSTYRMVVWGKMVDERPRSKGMPGALTAG